MNSPEQGLEGPASPAGGMQTLVGAASYPLWRRHLDQTLLRHSPAVPAQVQTRTRVWGSPPGMSETLPFPAGAEAPAPGPGELHAPHWASPPSRSAGLSPREWDVIALIITGRTNRVIAALLGISPNTVHKHVTAILDKLGARSRSEAIAVVLGLQELERDRPRG